MLNIENMEAGSQLITTITARNNPTPKSGQNDPSEDQPPDFLMDFLSKLCGEVKQGSEEGQANFGELNGLGKELLNPGSVESAFPIIQSGNTDSDDQALDFPLETTALKDQNEERGDEDQEKETIQFTTFPPLESLFIGKEDILKNFLNKTGNVNPSLSKAILLMPGEDAVTKSDQSPAAGAQVSGQGSGEGNPGLVPPKGEIPIERPSDTGIFLQEAGPNSGLSKASLLRDGEDPVTKPDRSSVAGAQVNGPGSGEGNPGLAPPKGEIPIERPSDTGIFLQGAGPNSGLNKASLLSDGVDPVTKSDRSPVAGAQVNESGSEKGRPGFVNTAEESPIERPDRKGSLDLKDGLKPRLDDDFLLDKLKTFVEKISQSLADGPDRNRDRPRGGKVKL